MRNARGWLVAFAILAAAVLIWNLGLQRQLAHEHAARRHSERAATAERKRLASGLAEANRRLVQLGGPPVVVVQTPSAPQSNANATTTSSLPRPPTSVTKPATTPTTKCVGPQATVPVLGSSPGVLCSG